MPKNELKSERLHEPLLALYSRSLELIGLEFLRLTWRRSEAQSYSMWQSFIFGMHWSHEGKMYYDELSAGSKEEAAQYFNDHKRDDVTLVRVELVGPDDDGVRESANPPVSPFSPLKARRRLDKDEDAR